MILGPETGFGQVRIRISSMVEKEKSCFEPILDVAEVADADGGQNREFWLGFWILSLIHI